MTTFYTLSTFERASVMFCPQTVDLTRDCIFTFEYQCAGEALTGAHGFCFFLANSENKELSQGSPGPGLGVTALTALNLQNVLLFYQGIPRTELCIGFDINGIFGSNRTGLDGPDDIVPNSICVRTGITSGFKFIYRTEDLSTSAFKAPIQLYTINYFQPFSMFRIKITDFGSTVIVDHKNKDAQEFTNVARIPLTFTLPKSAFPCLSFSSRTRINYMRVKNLNLNGYFV